MTEPRISIIIAVKNRAVELQLCLESIYVQTWPHREIIVLDAASDDGTSEVLERNTDRIDFWRSRPDEGIYPSWNEGLKQATGEWIMFLGSDDVLHDARALERMIPYLQSAYRDGCVYVYGKAARISKRHGIVTTVSNRSPEDVLAQAHKGRFMYHTGSLHHRSLFTHYGKFNETYRINGDRELLLQVFRDEKARYIPSVTVVSMRLGGISTSMEHLLSSRKEILRALVDKNFVRYGARLRFQILQVRVFMGLRKLLGACLMDKLADVYYLLQGEERKWSN